MAESLRERFLRVRGLGGDPSAQSPSPEAADGGDVATETTSEREASAKATGQLTIESMGTVNLFTDDGLDSLAKLFVQEMSHLKQGRENPLEDAAWSGTVGAQAAAPLTPQYPCVVCGIVDRWDDHGVWRCRACWPPEAMGKRRREG
jgi:hypothetical protein